MSKAIRVNIRDRYGNLRDFLEFSEPETANDWQMRRRDELDSAERGYAPHRADPFVGMGATFPVGSDRYAGTVCEILSEKSIRVARDHAIRTDDRGPFTESQSYRFERSDDEGTVYTLRKNGQWVRKGDSIKSGCGRVVLGFRDTYQDPTF